MNTISGKIDGRFAGIVGQEYEKLLRSIPHYMEVQNDIAQLASLSLTSSHKGEKKRMILDLGCGTGLTTLALCRHINQAYILAVDEEPKMLEQYKDLVIRKHKADLATSGITIKVVRNNALSFLKGLKSSSFDAAVTGFMLHNLPKKIRAKILKEIGRVLRPKGVFVNGDKIASDNEKLHQKHIMNQIGAFVNTYTSSNDRIYGLEWIEHYMRDNQPDIKYKESEVRKSLRAAGFRKIKITKRHGMEAVVVAIRL